MCLKTWKTREKSELKESILRWCRVKRSRICKEMFDASSLVIEIIVKSEKLQVDLIDSKLFMPEASVTFVHMIHLIN